LHTVFSFFPINIQKLILKNIIFFIPGGKLKAATKHKKTDNYAAENQVND
jgi:hypothetical protein